jgi:hypothetical protein
MFNEANNMRFSKTNLGIIAVISTSILVTGCSVKQTASEQTIFSSPLNYSDPSLSDFRNGYYFITIKDMKFSANGQLIPSPEGYIAEIGMTKKEYDYRKLYPDFTSKENPFHIPLQYLENNAVWNPEPGYFSQNYKVNVSGNDQCSQLYDKKREKIGEEAVSVIGSIKSQKESIAKFKKDNLLYMIDAVKRKKLKDMEDDLQSYINEMEKVDRNFKNPKDCTFLVAENKKAKEEAIRKEKEDKKNAEGFLRAYDSLTKMKNELDDDARSRGELTYSEQQKIREYCKNLSKSRYPAKDDVFKMWDFERACLKKNGL